MSTVAERVALPALRGPKPPAPGDGAAGPPQPARGLELFGRFAQSGHVQAPGLVRRADGQTIQITPLLYEILREIDGRRTYSEIAQSVGPRVGKILTPEDVELLTESKLRPLGLLRGLDGSEPVTHKANPLLALRFRLIVTNSRVTNAIAGLFSWLFAPPIMFAAVVSFTATIVWLLFERGLGAATRNAIYEPHLLLLVFGLTTLSAGFHELGHAAACRYSGAKPGAMGVGLYLLWPAFYTDVSDSYRLDRRGRLRVDLGGIYFNAVFGVAALALWAFTGWEALLVVIALQALQMLRQLIPLIRLDGYHILADLTGVPDLFAHIKPILSGLNPSRSRRVQTPALKRSVRLIVTTWVLVVVPVLAGVFAVLVYTLPRVIATAWDSLGLQWTSLRQNMGSEHFAAAGVDVLAILALAIPILSLGYLIGRVVLRASRRVKRATEGHPGRRVLAITVATALIAALTIAWWPNGQYRPIQEDERGRLPGLAAVTESIKQMVTPPYSEPLSAEANYDLPQTTGLEPDANGVMAPIPSPSDQAVSPVTELRDPPSLPTPAPPGEGDNQALALNTEDGATVLEIALSLIFAGDEMVDNSNEAYAMASCLKCVTIAIAFQVVVILNETATVVPENVAAAINVECAICLTYAIATQLVVSVTEPLTPEEMDQLSAIFIRLERLEAKASKLSLDEILTRLNSLREEIAEILIGAEEDGELILQDTTESPSPEPSETPSGSPSPQPSQSPSGSPSPSPSESPSSSPSPEPSQSPSP
ncbi:MAG TPA: M50 family metallopeptidase [Actinomycetota bacterium]|nr:M50 family metallopeptidase [Actinomycetota bacterium]